jgi:tetratricopeptide (TPR) repeat protein
MDKKYAFGYVLDQWSRGMAYAQLHQPGEAKKMLASLQSGMQHADLQVENTPFSKPFDQITVGEKILQGIIAIEDNNLKAAVEYLKEAVVAEDKLIYTEPRDWLIPARYYLSKALILSKQFKSAEKFCKEDLTINPNNYHSLLLLKQIYTEKKDIKKLDQLTKQLSTLYPR